MSVSEHPEKMLQINSTRAEVIEYFQTVQDKVATLPHAVQGFIKAKTTAEASKHLTDAPNTNPLAPQATGRVKAGLSSTPPNETTSVIEIMKNAETQKEHEREQIALASFTVWIKKGMSQALQDQMLIEARASRVAANGRDLYQALIKYYKSTSGRTSIEAMQVRLQMSLPWQKGKDDLAAFIRKYAQLADSLAVLDEVELSEEAKISALQTVLLQLAMDASTSDTFNRIMTNFHNAATADKTVNHLLADLATAARTNPVLMAQGKIDGLEPKPELLQVIEEGGKRGGGASGKPREGRDGPPPINYKSLSQEELQKHVDKHKTVKDGEKCPLHKTKLGKCSHTWGDCNLRKPPKTEEE